MKLIRTGELIGAALDWAVAKCEGEAESAVIKGYVTGKGRPAGTYEPSTNWAQGGPIIEREKICIDAPDDLKVRADYQAFIRICVTGQARKPHYLMNGPTPLIAAMRCYVASKLGDEVEIPDELVC